jgi:XTP/dITP diphosphohydrolase
MAEAKEIIGDIEQKNIGYHEIQADTLEEVVAYGLNEVVARIKGPVMIEDAGLFVDALLGFPGVYSAYVQHTIGNKGLLRLMEGIDDRRASFRSIVGYVEPGIDPVTFMGEMSGRIGFEERGCKGFGYDPIFYVGDRSLGEMELPEKNAISHRGASMRALKEWLEGRR